MIVAWHETINTYPRILFFVFIILYVMRVLQGKMLIKSNRINTFRGFYLYYC